MRQSYFEEKKQTKQLKSQDKKTPPIIRSFIFSYFSQLWTFAYVVGAMWTMCEQDSVQRASVQIADFWIQPVLDSSS